MKKPEKHQGEPYWDYFEVNAYLNDKKYEYAERRLWREIINTQSISNGSYFWIETCVSRWDSEAMSDFKEALRSEFPEEKSMKFWVEW